MRRILRVLSECAIRLLQPICGAEPRHSGQGIELHNNADTFKAYDAGRAIGDVQPGSPLPVASAARRGRCGIVGQILMVAVAVAVTYFTAGAATGLVGPVLGGAAAGGWRARHQAFGTVTNIQPGKINFKGVAMAALSGAVGAGVGQIGTIGKVGSGLANASAKVSNLTGRWPPCRMSSRLCRQRRDAGPCDRRACRRRSTGPVWPPLAWYGGVWHHEPLDQRAGRAIRLAPTAVILAQFSDDTQRIIRGQVRPTA